MSKIPMGSFKGPEGPKGDQGDVGPAGPNTVPTDQAIANAVQTEGSATKAALSGTYATPGQVDSKIATALDGFDPPVDVTQIPRRQIIGNNLATARANWAGPIDWYTTVVGGVPEKILPGDVVTVYEEAAVPIPVWSPGDLTPFVWYSALNMPLGVAASIPDSSSHGRTMNVVSGSGATVESTPMARKAFTFGGSTHYGAAVPDQTGKDITVAWVATVPAVSGPSRTFFGNTDGNANRFEGGLTSAGIPVISRAAVQRSATAAIASTAPHVYFATFSASGVGSLEIDGTAVINDPSTSAVSALTQLLLGARNRSGTADAKFLGSLGDLVMIDRLISAAEKAKLIQYLQTWVA
jgi:hypothetical protein